MTHRIETIQKILAEKSVLGFFITNPKNIFYLSGFIGISPQERESTFFVTNEKAYLFVPAMYQERAQKTISKNVEIITDHERYGLLTSFTKYITETDTILVESTNLTLAEFEKIQNATKSKLQPEKFLIEQSRILKDEQEIQFLQRACEVTDQTFNAIVKLLQNTDYTQITEMDIADYMRSISRELGAHGFGFDPIIASGAGAAEPHYFTSTKKLEKNNCLLLDFGFVFNGYTADLTRTIFLGKAPDEFKKMYSLVKECNETCIQACKSGITTKALHSLSFQFFKEKNVEKHYLHSLGHGVGLDVHEAPGVGMNNEIILEPNMIITIEPGLYFPNQFGIRIEDVVLVKKDSAMVLSSQSSKELIEIF